MRIALTQFSLKMDQKVKGKVIGNSQRRETVLEVQPDATPSTSRSVMSRSKRNGARGQW